MIPADGSADEMPSSAVELETQYHNSWPGGSIVADVRSSKLNSNDLANLNVCLLTPAGNSIADASPRDGTAVLKIPHNCEAGDYLVCVFQGTWCLDSVPFEITSRRIAELTRKLLLASVLQAEAWKSAQDPLVDPDKVMRLANEVEHLYVPCGEARLARQLWEEISDAFRQRGLKQNAQEAAARARALEPSPKFVHHAATPKSRLSATSTLENRQVHGLCELAPSWVGTDVSALYERYAPQLRLLLAQHSGLKHKVEDLLQDVFLCLLRYPPTEALLRPDSYLWRIAWRQVNRANKKAKQDRERLTMATTEMRGWVFGQSSTPSPTNTMEWLAYREQVRQSLEELKPKERQAVLLARLGYSRKEIAAGMEIDVKSVRKYLRQGYLNLKAFNLDDKDNSRRSKTRSG